MNVAINIFTLLVAAAILVAETNVIKNTTYVSTKEGIVGFAVSAVIVAIALFLATTVEW